ncbi:hypothetical protein ACJJTC_014466 [Scirpophaga incertulas]
MKSTFCCILVCLICTARASSDVDFENEMISSEDRWKFRQRKQHQQYFESQCLNIRPTSKDIVRRFCAILPYIDRDHLNTAFLHKLRSTIYNMSEGKDVLDREAAYYAAVVTPIVFLQQYRGAWCLLERFHRALRLYQISHPTEKRSSLKSLQSMIEINRKIRTFVFDLSGATTQTPSRTYFDVEGKERKEKGDMVYFKELIKNFERF